VSSPTDSPRILTPQRKQLELRTFDLDATLPDDHRARAIWTVVERLDLAAFYDRIQSRGENAGRPATDPRILLALWLYATAEGIGSARQLERLCSSDDAYRWICGGVSVNYHTLSDFRVDHESLLDDLMTQVLGAMIRQGLVTMTCVAQDGTRVRADAGAASFRREAALADLQQQARLQIERLKQELADDPGAHARLERTARERAARERADAIERALSEMPAVAEVKRRNRGKKGKKQTEPRVSTTDPEARVMKMADGGFRPAFNVQLATDVDSRVIVGVAVTNSGSDLSMLVPMLDDMRRRTGLDPGEILVDGGYVTLASLQAAHQRGITTYAPVKTTAPKSPSGCIYNRTDAPAIALWRSRMQRPDAKAIYRQRAATAETVNADLRRWRTLDRFPVRGLRKARCHALLNAMAYNALRWTELADPRA